MTLAALGAISRKLIITRTNAVIRAFKPVAGLVKNAAAAIIGPIPAARRSGYQAIRVQVIRETGYQEKQINLPRLNLVS